MKKARPVFILLCMLFLLTRAVCAETAETDKISDSLPEEVAEVLEDMGINDDYQRIAQTDILDFVSALMPSFKRSVKVPLGRGGILLALLLICMLANTLSHSNGSLEKISACIMALLLFVPLVDTFTRMTYVISACSGFMKTYVPICAGAAAASGKLSTATAYSAFQLTLCSVCQGLAENVILPLSGMLMSLCAVTSIEETAASGVADALLKILKWAIGLISVLAGGFFSLQTGIASASDGIALRSAKFALSGFLPIIGGSVSEAFGTVVSAASVVRTYVGAVGIIAVLILLLPTALELAAWSILCKLLAFASRGGGLSAQERLFERTASVINILTAVTALTGIMFIFSTAVLLKSGASV